MRRIALAVALALTIAACTHDTQGTTAVRLADPGRCAAVDVAAATEVAPQLGQVAGDFNDDPAARLGNGKCAFVRVHAIESADAAARLVDDWPDPTDDGPAPALWAPASSAWITVANARRAAHRRPAVAHRAKSFARTPIVIAMPAPMAHALGWPDRPVGWRTLADLAANPLGWAAYGHPEWGAFRLGKPSPERSTTGLLAATAVARLDDANVARALESSVIYYGDASWPFFDKWYKLDRTRQPLSYVSAVIADQRAVDAYNTGSPNGVPAADGGAKPPHTPVVGIVPADGPLESDNPLAPIDAPWVTPDTLAGAEAFITYAGTAAAQQRVTKAGLLPGGQTIDLAHSASQFAPRALDDWAGLRKRARLLLVFDVSDSMGDLSDPRDEHSPSKIERAKAALLAALPQLAPDDEVGLRIFTTDVDNQKGRSWADVVPIGPYEKQKGALARAIDELTPHAGSPVYAATRSAYDTIASDLDPARINGVVLLTDGYNEVDSDNHRAALLAHLHEPVRMFTISYSPDADLKTLARIAQATNARVYDATTTKTIDDIYRSALSNF